MASLLSPVSRTSAVTKPRQLAPTVGPAHGGVVFLEGALPGIKKLAIRSDEEEPAQTDLHRRLDLGSRDRLAGVRIPGLLQQNQQLCRLRRRSQESRHGGEPGHRRAGPGEPGKPAWRGARRVAHRGIGPGGASRAGKKNRPPRKIPAYGKNPALTKNSGLWKNLAQKIPALRKFELSEDSGLWKKSGSHEEFRLMEKSGSKNSGFHQKIRALKRFRLMEKFRVTMRRIPAYGKIWLRKFRLSENSMLSEDSGLWEKIQLSRRIQRLMEKSGSENSGSQKIRALRRFRLMEKIRLSRRIPAPLKNFGSTAKKPVASSFNRKSSRRSYLIWLISPVASSLKRKSSPGVYI